MTRGPYDVWAIHWGYGIFPKGTEQDSLRAIVAEVWNVDSHAASNEGNVTGSDA